MMTLILLVSCGSDKGRDDLIDNLEANAKGYLVIGGESVVLDELYFWINDYVILRYMDVPITCQANLDLSKPYHPFNSMDIIYSFLSDEYGMEINENTDFSKLNPNPEALVKKMKNLKSQYKYIAIDYGYIYIFNRTSSKNY